MSDRQRKRIRDAGDILTDLALEAHEQARQGVATLPGVSTEEQKVGNAIISRVRVETDEASRLTGKRKGNYVTLEAAGLRKRNLALQEEIARTLAGELGRMLALGPDTSILVVGLGNWNATPDALGPRVMENLLVTRHLKDFVPVDMRGGLRSVAAVAPGVLGLTGIETGEIILGIAQRLRPDLIIAVDALASRSIDRILTTIQIADTGIDPGSGVGNDRKSITRESLGVPTYAIGVPTVVHAATIANDTIELLIEQLREKDAFYKALAAMDRQEKQQLIKEVMNPEVGDLMVTPKEIDVLMDDMSRVVAAGINAALHPKVAAQESIL